MASEAAVRPAPSVALVNALNAVACVSSAFLKSFSALSNVTFSSSKAVLSIVPALNSNSFASKANFASL